MSKLWIVRSFEHPTPIYLTQFVEYIKTELEAKIMELAPPGIELEEYLRDRKWEIVQVEVLIASSNSADEQIERLKALCGA